MRTRNHRIQLDMQSLEARDVPSVTSLWFSNDMLVVQTNDAPTEVRVYQEGSNYRIQEGGSNRSWYYWTGWINKIEFQGGAGNDRFLNYVANLPVRGFGFGGNDYLEGYSSNDVFVGGDGNDTFKGYGGNDSIWGGNGHDQIHGMSGNDYLVGDSGNDIITGSSGNDSIWGGNGHDKLSGQNHNDYLVGGDGNDTITGDHGDDRLDGQNGHDALIGGDGTDSMYGGNGNDSLVSIDANYTDYSHGGNGHDTVWRDVIWILSDTAYAEKIQSVSSFANGADRSLNGDRIADPTDGTFYKNFRDNPLFAVGGPSIHDVDQETVGDCWIMASLGSVAHDNPLHIREMVADFGDGTYGVRLGSRFYRVDADLSTWSASSTDQRFAGLGTENSLWVAIVEKAYTHHRTGANTYNSIGWGDPADAMRQLNATSVGQRYFAPGSSNATSLANEVYNRWNAYQSCTVCTGTVASGSPLVASHCYSVFSVSRNASGQVTSITLRNPWGGDNTSGNPFVTMTPNQLAANQIWVTWGNT